MSINKKLYNRLSAQIEELDHLGFKKEAGFLNSKLASVSIRDDDSGYKVDSDELELSVQADLFNSLIKVADFHGVSHIAIDDVLPLLEKQAKELISSYQEIQHITEAVSSFEEPVPGEK
jgi:hypothetical protein